MSSASSEIRELRRRRPRSQFLRWSVIAALGLGAYAWSAGDFQLGGLLSERRLDNLQRFLAELRPYPLRSEPFDLGVALRWADDIMAEKGTEAAWITLAISVAAIALAAMGAAVLSLPATRVVACPEPFLPAARPPTLALRALWSTVSGSTRTLLVFLRAIPEFVWAFLFIGMIGPTAWPAVLALALHNVGILGRLNSEAIENLERPTLEALRGLGGSRSQIAAVGVFPAAFARFLLYFFYRWETCVREATVLGMLGIVSLGYWIQDARARNQYDTMLLLVLIGAAIVLLGDLVSTLARWLLRHSN